MDLSDFVLAAAGPAMNWLANKQVAQRQNAINNQSTGYKTAQANRSMGATSSLLGSMTPAAQTTQLADAKSTLTGNLNKSLMAARSYEGGAPGGRVSSDYARVFGQNAALGNDRVGSEINSAATINAPALKAQGDARRMLDTASTISSANQASNNVGAQYDAAMGTVRRNPLLDFGSQIANGLNLLRAGKKRPSLVPMQTTDAYAPNYIGGTSEGE